MSNDEVLTFVIGMSILAIFVLPIIPGLLAKRKKRSFFVWYFFSAAITFLIPSIIPGFIVGILMVYILPALAEELTFSAKISAASEKSKKLIVPFLYGLLFSLLCAVLLVISIKFEKSFPWLSSFLSGTEVLVPALQSNVFNYHIISVNLSDYILLAAIILQAILLIRKRFTAIIDFYLLLLVSILWLFSLISGSIWSNTAWGSYWSWDPKETWSLIALGTIIQACALSIAGRVMEQTKKGCTVSFIFNFVVLATILFTRYGVNFVLKGLHSYSN